MKIDVPAVFLLLALKSAFPQYTVHIFHPWSTDPQRSVQPVHLIAPLITPSYPGDSMAPEARKPWHRFTWTESQMKPQSQFYFASYIPTSFNVNANPANYYDGDVQFNTSTAFPFGVKEIWIVPNGADKATFHTEPPWFQGAKVALLFNPWPMVAPMAKVNGDSVYSILPMVQDPRRCGWYRVNFPDSVRKVHFKSSLGSEIYGLGGSGSSQVMDLTSAFAMADTLFLLPEPYPHGAPKVLNSFPTGISGICQFPLAMTVRDFSLNHPDFQVAKPTDGVSRGMVENSLGPDQKPVQGPTPHTYQSHFETWFKTDSTHADSTLRNYETCRDLPLSKTAKGGWGYDSYNERSHSFFPVDGFNRFGEASASMYRDREGNYRRDSTGLHNFHFCLEMHAEFTYHPAQTLVLEGDDDIWVYVDNKLALDLGGIHLTEQGTIRFDQLGLIVGKVYPLDLFFCERQSDGSNFTFETSAFLSQANPFFAMRVRQPDGTVKYSVYENPPSNGQCASQVGSGDTIPASTKFTLEGPSAPSGIVLPVGNSYGGFTVSSNKSQLTIDTSKVVGLSPGLYVITYASEATGRYGKFLFTVPGTVPVGRQAGIGSPMLQVYTAGSRRLQVRFQPGEARDGKGFAEVKVMSLHGATVYRKVIPGAGAFTESIDGAEFKSGVYMVTVKSGNRLYSRRVVIP